MTDWWAKSNYEGHQAEVQVKAPMVAAQNDIYMVVSDAKANPEKDDVEEMLHAGKITWVSCREMRQIFWDFC